MRRVYLSIEGRHHLAAEAVPASSAVGRLLSMMAAFAVAMAAADARGDSFIFSNTTLTNPTVSGSATDGTGTWNPTTTTVRYFNVTTGSAVRWNTGSTWTTGTLQFGNNNGAAGTVSAGSSGGAGVGVGQFVFAKAGSGGYSFQSSGSTSSIVNTITIGSGTGIIVNSDVAGDTTFLALSAGTSSALTVALGANQTWTNNSTSRLLIMNSSVTGAFSLTTNGPGLIVLGGSNSFSGGLTAGAGTLRATDPNALSSGAVTVSSGATLDIRASITKNVSNSGTVSIGAGGNLSASSLGGALSLGGVSGTAATFTSTLGSGTLALGSLAASGNTNISLAAGSQITSTGGVNFTGSSNLLTLTGAAASPGTYTLITGSSLSGTSGLSLTGGAIGSGTIALGSSALFGRNTYQFNSTLTALQLAVTGTIFDLTWNGGASGTWDTSAANWQQNGTGSNIAFVTNDNVTFGSATTVSVPASIAAGTMAISNAAGSVVLSGAGGITASSLSKSGAGSATIGNNATVANGVTVSAGTLTVNGTLGVTAGGITVNGGSLTSGSTTTITAGGLSVAGGTYTANAATTISAGGLTVSSGSATLNNASTITGGITVSGGGLALNAANTVSGVTSVTGGVLSVGATGAIGSGTATINGGTLAAAVGSISVAAPIVVGASGATVTNDGAFTLSGAITGSNNVITKTGVGELTISGAMGASRAGLQVNVNAGSLVLAGASAKEFGGTSVVNGNVTINNSTVTLSQNAGFNGTGTIATTGTSTINVRNGSTGGTKTITNPVSLDGTASLIATSGGNLILTGAVSGSGSVTTSGAAKVGLTGTAGMFTGSLTVNNSGANGFTEINTLAIRNATGITVNRNASLTSADGDLQLTNTVQDELAAVISGAGILSISAGTNRAILSGSNTFSGGTNLKGDVGIKDASGLGSGTVTALSSGARVFWDGAGSTVTLANNLSTGGTSSYALAFAGAGKTWTPTGTISGSGQLKVSGGAILDLRSQTAVKSTYTGGLEIGTGSVIVDTGDDLGSGGGAINFGTGTASFLLVGGTGTSLTLSNPFTIGSASGNGYTANFDTNGNSLTISSAIVNKAGNANGGLLNKLGAGSLVLSGSNGYTGATTVSAGRLAVNGSLDAASAVSVLAGATLGGSGTIGGITTVAGIIAPGNSIGTLTIANDLVWNGAATAGSSTDWLFELEASNTSDLLAINGGASDFIKDSTAGSIYRFDFGGSSQQGTFTLVSWGGATNFSAGDFSYTGLANGNTATFSIDGSNLNVVVVPEPTSLVLFSLGVAGLFAGQRRIRRGR